MTERDIQAAIRLALGARRDVVLWRNNVGLAEHHGQRVRYGLTEGSADLIGLVRMASGLGRFFALEIKTLKGRLQPAQKMWLELVRDYGGFAAVVRSEDEAVAAVERCKAGEDQ
jgi:hypothetical protein